MNMEHRWNDTDEADRGTWRYTCPTATPCTINLAQTDPGSNPGFRGERPATDRLSHGKFQRQVDSVAN
jgi:hypothetical protein